MEANKFPHTFLFFILLSALPITHCSAPTTCNTTFSINNTETSSLLKAFSAVSGFSPSLLLHTNSSSDCPPPPASPITQLLLPSKNLSGTISWKYIINLTQLHTIDLSNNSLQGNIPIWFWSLNPNLRKLNISNNHFGGTIGFKHPNSSSSSPSGIQVLDASNNRFTKLIGVSGFTNLSYLDVSGNGLRKIPRGGFSGLGGMLEVLNMKRCNVTGGLDGGGGIKGLNGLKYLDLSENELEGEFPTDFPRLDGLSFLNVSFNRFSGDVVTVNKYQQIFGKSAFIRAGNFSTTASSLSNGTHTYHTASSPSSNSGEPTTPPPPTTHHIQHHHHHHHQNNSKSAPQTTSQKQSDHRHHKINKRKKKLIKVISIGTSAFLFSSLLLLTLLCYCRNRSLRRQKSKWAISKPLNQHSFPFPSASDVPSSPSSSKPTAQNKSALQGPFSFETESGSSWAADIKEPTSAPVVMFEKPLINYITFKDLIVGTCRFGRESQLGEEGKCGPVYRGVLPGELHVAVKVLEYLEGFRRLERKEAVSVFEELALFRHPNLLPIAGYCIAGKEKLILNEYMPNGDLHSWLHDLPPGMPDVDDWSTDTWDDHTNPTGTAGDHHLPIPTASSEKRSFHTRHRMAVGIARGLAYLHHARSKPLVHGHLVPSNILLTEGLEPRISDFGLSVYGGGSGRSGVGSTTEDDVYCFGLILIELFTGKPADEDGVVGRVRRLVKNGNVDQVIDPRLRVMMEGGWVSQMVECLRVGYLCTAEVPGKRPTMQQVVGLLKDVNTTSTQGG